MKITLRDVEYVSRLALLALGDEEKEKMARELSSILEYMEKMGELVTDDVHPTAHVLDIKNVFRPDVVKEEKIREEALAAAPRSEKGFFKVLSIMDPGNDP